MNTMSPEHSTKQPFLPGHCLRQKLFHSIIMAHLKVIAPSQYTPVITSMPVTTATEDVIYTYTFTVDDQDAGDVLTLSAVSKPDWLNFNWTPGQKSAVLTGTPGNENTGILQMLHCALMTVILMLIRRFTINVAAVNDLPVITGQNSMSSMKTKP